jgi:CBS domain-containing protein
LTQAQEIMRDPGLVVSAGRPAAAAVQRLRRERRAHLIAVDGDEVAGVLSFDALLDLEREGQGLGEEMIGNLVSAEFRTCRPTDDIRALRAVLRRSGVAIIVVTEADGKVRGLITADDLDRAADPGRD